MTICTLCTYYYFLYIGGQNNHFTRIENINVEELGEYNAITSYYELVYYNIVTLLYCIYTQIKYFMQQ